MKRVQHPLLWLIVAIPLSSVAMGVFLLVLAFQSPAPPSAPAAQTPALSKTSWREE